MRAMKRPLSVLLSLMLVLGMLTIGMSAVSAAETKSIAVTSNIGAASEAQYSETSEQVTVTFKLKSDLTIVATQAVITFDTTVLKVASTNTAATVMPNFSDAVVNLTKTDGRIPMNWTNYHGNEAFKGTEAVYATVVFDIIKKGVDTTVNLEVADLTGSTDPAAGVAKDVKIIDTFEEICDTTHFTASVEEKVTPDEESGTEDFGKFLYTYMGNFEGKVGLVHFFYANPQGYDPSTLTIKFDGPLEEYNKTMKYSDMDKINANIARYDYFVYSVMFAQPITVSIYQGDTLLAKAAYSIEQYIEDKLPTADADMANFYKAVLNYGGYAQVKFNEYTDSLANKNIDSTLTPVDPSTITLPAGVGVMPDVSAVGISSLYDEQGEYLDDTRIRQFYVVSDATKLKPATVAGPASSATAEFTKINNQVYQLIIPNIGSADLDEIQTVTYGNGAVYKTTMISRVKSQLAKEGISEADKNFFTALYWYNQTANTYFGA